MLPLRFALVSEKSVNHTKLAECITIIKINCLDDWPGIEPAIQNISHIVLAPLILVGSVLFLIYLEYRILTSAMTW